MRQIVVMPGGFHPFHAGHASLYQSAIKAFPGAEVYVAATNDTKTRPFPFKIKEKLAKVAGVAPGHFVQVKSPFKAEEITSHYNPNQDVLIFVRSEKDKNEQPKPGGTKKDGTSAYFQPWTGKNLRPFSQHAYMAYLPTVEFGPGISSATEIRNAWPKLNDKRKTAMVMSLYPATQKNPKLAANVVQLLNMGMGEQENVAEGSVRQSITENRLFVKKLNSEQELIEHAKLFAKNLSSDGVPISSKNRHTVVCSTIFAHSKRTLKESTHISSGNQAIKTLKRLDQFSQLPIKVGSKIAIINSQLQGDSMELWGFTTPKTITKINRDPSDNSIKQFEFNNDPDDVWPRTVNAEYNGKFLMYSAFFGDKKSAKQALIMLTLQSSEDLDIRNHIKEQDVVEGIMNENASKLLSAEDRNGVITVVVQAPDGTKKSLANDNIRYINQWLMKYNLELPRHITSKFIEDTSPAIADTAKSLANPPKVMQHRAKRDQEREQQWLGTQMVNRDKTHKDDWGDLKESIVCSDKVPKLSGLSFKELDKLVEGCGSNYSMFDLALKKNLNLPNWANTLEIYGVYLRKLNENKLGKVLSEGEQTDIEHELFRKLSLRSSGSIDFASVGDKVSLLHLITLNIPGYKVVAQLNGFLNPKEIVEIDDTGPVKQLTFSDGSTYPKNKDKTDVFKLAQVWNMTKLFPSYELASKAYVTYGLIGDEMGEEIDFKINVDKNIIESKNPSVEQPAHKEISQPLFWSDLDEGMSVEDKMTIFEEFYALGSLTESTSEDNTQYFNSLLDLATVPIKNKKYIVVPITLVNNKTMLLDVPSYMIFLGRVPDGMKFKSSTGEKVYPSPGIRKLSVFQIFTFDNQTQYDKFKTAISIKFDIVLPEVKPNKMNESKNLSVEQLAQISDKALDDAYHYGRSTPGANFGWMANVQSARAAKRLIDSGETDIEKISDAIHQGWNVTAAADYKGQLQLDTPTPDEKKLKRAKLAMQSYSQLPEDEKEKDRVVARALLQASKGEVTEGFNWTDYNGIGMNERLMIAETYFTKNRNLFESNDPKNSDYFLSLTSMSSPLRKNKKYIGSVLAMVSDTVMQISDTEIVTLLGKTGNKYSVLLSNGFETEFPNRHLSDKMSAATFFFDNINAYEKFRSILSLKYDFSLVAPDEIKGNKDQEVEEGFGLPMPSTYEQENNKFKRTGSMRITDMTEMNRDYLDEK